MGSQLYVRRSALGARYAIVFYLAGEGEYYACKNYFFWFARLGCDVAAASDGSALVIHATLDDDKSQPIGGSGARIVCAEIK